jgi:hypothetical protein
MAVSAEKCDRPTVGLIAVTLPADGPQLRHVRLDERTVLVGYDPRVLNEYLVGLWLDAQFPAGYELESGVPA